MAEKGNSPFYPNHPVPVEFFVGRQQQRARILERGVKQVANGRMVPMFIQGEYGIGKTSLASLAQQTAEVSFKLHPIYCPLGGCKNLTDVAQALLQSTIRSRALDPSKAEEITNFFSKYIGKQDLFGIATLNFQALKADAPQLASPFGTLQFLEAVQKRLGSSGLFLVLDEINGIAGESIFAHFLKALVDANGAAARPVPLLLMMCGVEERRRELIRHHQPIERIFDIIQVDPMSRPEARAFFQATFQSANIVCDDDAADFMAEHSAGFPKIMQLVGDSAYWKDDDNHIHFGDAVGAVLEAAQEVGRRYFDQQVYKLLRSRDYRSILNKIAKLDPIGLSFTKAEIEGELTETEKGKLGNFLRRMKTLNVNRPGDERGEWVFNVRMVRLYLFMQAAVPPHAGRE
jgi:AAA ATPase domain